MSVWMSSNFFFQIATAIVFVRFLGKLAQMMYVPMWKEAVEQIFKILLGKFFKFQIGTYCFDLHK